MFDDSRSFIGRAFLQSIYDIEFKAYLAEGRDEIVHTKLKAWDGRARQTETQDESAFIQSFFVELLGVRGDGPCSPGGTYDHSEVRRPGCWRKRGWRGSRLGVGLVQGPQ